MRRRTSPTHPQPGADPAFLSDRLPKVPTPCRYCLRGHRLLLLYCFPPSPSKSLSIVSWPNAIVKSLQRTNMRVHHLPWRASIVWGFVLTVAGVSHAQMKPGDVRRAYGEARASVIESVLKTIYPDARVQWDPQLAIQFPGEKPRMVQVPVYVRGRAATGGLEGVATIELDGQKERYIFEAQNFQRSDRPALPTELIVFRADVTGRIQNYKRIMLDEREPVTEVKDMSIEEWTRQEWPVLRIQYDTHRAAMGSFTTIEWRALLDADRGEFVSRIPMGITRRLRGGAEEMIPVGVKRTSSSTVVITSRDGESHSYSCSDPCVIDADTLLSGLKLNDPSAPTANGQTGKLGHTEVAQMDRGSSAIIRLKNGRVIHADSATEVGDKIEYRMGESEYRIPKSLVQEITHSDTPLPLSETPSASAQPTRERPGTDSSCYSNPHLGCTIAFYIQVLMGLGETQRFALLDHNGRDITAEAHWTIDCGSPVDFSVVGGVPHLYSKAYGSLCLFATVEGHIAMARVYILKPEDIQSNTMGRIGNPQFNDASRPVQIIVAAPYGGRIPGVVH
jgi:hypothetical protein